MAPPPNFIPAGTVQAVEIAPGQPPFITLKRAKGNKAAGLRYERKGHRYLRELYPPTCEGPGGFAYIESPWFRYLSKHHSNWHWCQPDGLLFNLQGGHIIIVEFKLRHTQSAWWQTKLLYLPVLDKLFNPDQRKLFTFSIVEVVKWFDPEEPFPTGFRFVKQLHQIAKGNFGVHIWHGPTRSPNPPRPPLAA